MARTLLQIVQAACDELGIPRPITVIGSMDAQAQQLLALSNRDGTDLALREGSAGGWQQLRREYTFDTVAGTDNYSFPTDLNYFINTTTWDRSQAWPLSGPLSPQSWQVIKSGGIGSIGPQTRFRVMQNRIYIDPVPSAVHTLVFEYYTNAWCVGTDGTQRQRWGSDTDTPFLPDDALVLGLIWRYLRAKRLDYAEEYSMYEEFVRQALGRSTMAPVLSITGGVGDGGRLLDNSNVPENGYGV